MFDALFYTPNIMNYVRFFLLIVVIFNIKTRPVLTFIASLISGIIDDFDGTLARRNKQTTVFGCILDQGMDRATTIIVCVVLTLFYPNYYLLLTLVILAESIADIAGCLFKYNNLVVSLLQNFENTDEKTAYSYLQSDIHNLANINKFQIDVPKNHTIQITASGLIPDAYLPFIWYTSDLFYWFIYFGAFVIMHHSSAQFIVHGCTIQLKPISRIQKTSFISNIYHKVKGVFTLIQYISIEIGDYLNKFLVEKLNLNRLANILRLKLIFRFVGVILLIGAILKTYLNLQKIFHFARGVALVDDEFIRLHKKLLEQ